MIETGLVYIHSARDVRAFTGCGALVEGPFVITCRHVWEQAVRAAAGGPVLVCFPPPKGRGEPVFEEAILADCCDHEGSQPDLVILNVEVPRSRTWLSVACASVAGSGPAAALAGLKGRIKSAPHAVDDVVIHGSIERYINSKGLCQFTGANGCGYWSDRGSSGSPVGLIEGTGLAGILCLSETGASPGGAELHEAFVLPASTIHGFLSGHVGRRAAEFRGVDVAKMPDILDLLGASGLSLAELRRRLDKYFDNVKAENIATVPSESAEAMPPSREGAMAALASARAFSAGFEPAAAMAVLDKALAEEARISGQLLLLLLVEKARQQQLFLDHQGATACLAVITVLDPDSYPAWISLGDTQKRIGNLKAALDAYRGGLQAAGHAGSQSDLANAHQRVGDVLRDTGDLVGALAEARAGLAITQSISAQDQTNADFQRDLSVSHNSVGTLLTDLGDFTGALQELDAGLAIIRHLCALEPDQTRWQHDLSISHERIGRVHLILNDQPAARQAFQAATDIRQTLSKRDLTNTEWQRELGVCFHKLGETHRAQALADAKAGDVSANAQQSLLNALTSFRAALAVFEPLAGNDPGNTDLQRDVSAAYSNIGHILQLQGDVAGALTAFRANLAIAERLADHDPNRADWQRDLLVSCEKMALVNPDGRRLWLGRALAIATRLAERGKPAPADAGMIPSLQARLAALPPDADPAAGPPTPTD